MPEWPILTGGGTGLLFLYLTYYHLRALSSSVKELIGYVKILDTSVGNLNVTMATVIANNASESKRIDENRNDIRDIFKLIRK